MKGSCFNDLPPSGDANYSTLYLFSSGVSNVEGEFFFLHALGGEKIWAIPGFLTIPSDVALSATPISG